MTEDPVEQQSVPTLEGVRPVRGWPRGKKRIPVRTAVEREPVREAPARKTTPLMKNAPNWDTGEELPDEMRGKLHIPREEFPEGFDLQWVATSVYGQEQPQNRSQYERTGWTALSDGDFNGKFDGRFLSKKHIGEITFQGLTLMARPMELTIKARNRQRREAVEPVLLKQQQLLGGHLDGVTLDAGHPSALRSNKINRTMERIDIPNE